MKRLLTIVLILLASIKAFSQNHVIYIGSKQFVSTKPWIFGNSNSSFLTVRVARNTQGGFCLLSTPTDFPNMSIRGFVLLYLIDGSVIKCYDRNAKDRVDGVSSSIYYFTQKEMEQLAVTPIRSIRYSIGSSDDGKPSNLDESYLVNNKIPKYTEENNAYDVAMREGDTFYPTSEEIFQLFSD